MRSKALIDRTERRFHQRLQSVGDALCASPCRHGVLKKGCCNFHCAAELLKHRACHEQSDDVPQQRYIGLLHWVLPNSQSSQLENIFQGPPSQSSQQLLLHQEEEVAVTDVVQKKASDALSSFLKVLQQLCCGKNR